MQVHACLLSCLVNLKHTLQYFSYFLQLRIIYFTSLLFGARITDDPRWKKVLSDWSNNELRLTIFWNREKYWLYFHIFSILFIFITQYFKGFVVVLSVFTYYFLNKVMKLLNSVVFIVLNDSTLYGCFCSIFVFIVAFFYCWSVHLGVRGSSFTTKWYYTSM